MYKADFAPYHRSLPHKNDCFFCVGWLDPKHPCKQGEVPSLFTQNLKRWTFSDNPSIDPTINRVRGIHWCQFCNSEIYIDIGRKHLSLLGNCDIIVPYENIYFCAPNLIYHYVTSHNYRPPPEFIAAVSQLSFDTDFDGQEIFYRLSGQEDPLKDYKYECDE